MYLTIAWVAMWHCIWQRKKQILRKIATLVTKFDWTPEDPLKEAAMLKPESIQQKVPQFAQALQQRYGEQWIELLHKTATMMQKLGDEHLLHEQILKSIDVPVLLGLGDKDPMVSLDQTRKVYSILPTINTYMLPNTKHSIEGVKVELLAMILEEYFKQSLLFTL
ncbi:MAG: hypothetical protein QM530_09230 [Phycisphaerales bacterium]|nr:hypothetical protein [Phycisphaerales bacterium]